MTTVSMKTKLSVPADQVWQIVGNFNGLADWHPAIETSELEGGGKRRRLKLADGSELVEQLEQTDKEGRRYEYTIVEGPLPLSGYRASLKVTPTDDGGCEVEWSSSFTPMGPEGDVQQLIRGVYEAGLQNLEKMFRR